MTTHYNAARVYLASRSTCTDPYAVRRLLRYAGLRRAVMSSSFSDNLTWGDTSFEEKKAIINRDVEGVAPASIQQYVERTVAINVKFAPTGGKQLDKFCSAQQFYSVIPYCTSKQAYFLPNGSLTVLPYDLITKMGTPVHINLPSHLLFKHDVRIGERGLMFSCIGRSYATELSKLKKLKVLTAPGWKYFTKDTCRSPNYEVKSVSGVIAAKRGNFFLYSQPIKIEDPEDRSKTRIVNFIGLATCTSYSEVKAGLYNEMFQIYGNHSNLIWNDPLSPFHRVLNTEERAEENRIRHPYDRYGNLNLDLSWTEETWNNALKDKLTNYTNKLRPPAELFSAFGVSEELKGSPLAIKLARMQDKKEALQNERQDKLLEKQRSSQNASYYKKQIKEYEEYIERTRKALDEAEASKAKAKTFLEKVEPMLSKVDEAIAGIEQKLEAQKQKLLEQSNGESYISTFMKGLEKTGFVVSDLIYSHVDTYEKVSIVKDKCYEVVASEKWRLYKMKAYTNKPIPMKFGLSGTPDKDKQYVSGPHYLEITQGSPGGAPNLAVRPLTPWAAISDLDGESTFKPYPHVEAKYIKTEDKPTPAEYWERMSEELVYTCMGELSATALNAFNSNDPKMLALAITSFLQSVNPDDPWGKHYTYFPEAQDYQEDMAWGSYEKAKAKKLKTGLLNSATTLYLNKAKTRYVNVINTPWTGADRNILPSLIESTNGFPERATSVFQYGELEFCEKTQAFTVTSSSFATVAGNPQGSDQLEVDSERFFATSKYLMKVTLDSFTPGACEFKLDTAFEFSCNWPDDGSGSVLTLLPVSSSQEASV